MSWVDSFISRNSDSLISRWTAGLDNNRYKADSGAKYKLYFTLLQEKIEQYRIEPRFMYNIDEKGFLLGNLARSKRIFDKPLYELKTIRQTIQDGDREWISPTGCICGNGSALDPAFIYQADSANLQSSWVEEINPEHYTAFIISSSSGWSNNELGLAWLQQVFDHCTREKAQLARQAYRLLILDGHESHVTMDFINYCDQNRILLAILPHSTYTLQPLDVCVYRPLSAAYSNEIAAFLHRSQGLVSIAKRDFFGLF